MTTTACNCRPTSELVKAFRVYNYDQVHFSPSKHKMMPFVEEFCTLLVESHLLKSSTIHMKKDGIRINAVLKSFAWMYVL